MQLVFPGVLLAPGCQASPFTCFTSVVQKHPIQRLQHFSYSLLSPSSQWLLNAADTRGTHLSPANSNNPASQITNPSIASSLHLPVCPSRAAAAHVTPLAPLRDPGLPPSLWWLACSRIFISCYRPRVVDSAHAETDRPGCCGC
jgi:hypothetical protein